MEDKGQIENKDNINGTHSIEEHDSKRKKTQKKRTDSGFSRPLRIIFCYLVPALMVTALIITGIWGSRQQALAEDYKLATESMYRQAYTELTDSVYNLQIMLSKLMVSEAPSTLALALDDIWRESGVCVGLMGQIPQSHIDNYEMNSFLIRLGDYARSLSKTVMRGKPISDDDRKQLQELYNASIEVHSQLQTTLDSGNLPMQLLTSEQFFTSENGVDTYDASDDADSRYPTLIYDGPFSESTEKQEARGVTGEDIDENTALERAYAILGDNSGNLTLSTVSNGKIASYDFDGTLADGRHVDISITVRGGHLIWMMSSTSSDIAGVPADDEKDALVSIGLEWLQAQGFGEMAPTYAQYYSGAALISFAAVQDDALIYNDLVKVWIDRANQMIVGADCRNYLFSHIERDFPEELMDEDEVRGMLSPNLNIMETNLALVPATSQTEVLCYEFKGTFGEDEYVVYLDAVTGDEVQIFRIINDENGQLAL
ncbi:MAG: germination protein YpeB [Christensenellaceae bacterium]|nr:germination protein YpeB [Christensenellaceae bacterium]